MSSHNASTSRTPHPQRLHTPSEAAQYLTIKESWLRRKAGTRSIPCTFLGKHLRFSDHDLDMIIQHGHINPRHYR